MNLLGIRLMQTPRKTKHHHLGKYYVGYLSRGKLWGKVGTRVCYPLKLSLCCNGCFDRDLGKQFGLLPCTSDKNNINTNWSFRVIILSSSGLILSILLFFRWSSPFYLPKWSQVLVPKCSFILPTLSSHFLMIFLASTNGCDTNQSKREKNLTSCVAK